MEDSVLLSAAGIDTIHVGDIGFAAAEDADILVYGLHEGRVIVTLDADFHALLANTNAVAPSVIRIRISGLRAEALVSILTYVVPTCSEDLERGAMVTVQDGKVRVRRLPIR